MNGDAGPANQQVAPGGAAGAGRRETAVALSILMPVYNEAENLRRVLDEVIQTMAGAPLSYELVLVDDASTDRSLDILLEYRRRYPHLVRFEQHPHNLGIAAAFRTLEASAQGDCLFTIGSDGQWRVAECLRMMELINRYDVIVGRRASKHYSLLRKVVSGLYNLLPAVLFGVRTYDAGSIKLYRKELCRLPVISRGVFDQAERLIRAGKRGYRIGVIDVEHFPRTGGASQVNFPLVAEAAIDLARCWWRIVVLRQS